MTDQPTQDPIAMTLEEALKHLGDTKPDLILVFDHGKWYVQDLATDFADVVGSGDTWHEALSAALGRPVVARDEAAELKAAVKRYLDAQDKRDREGSNSPRFTELDVQAGEARFALRRLVGTEES